MTRNLISMSAFMALVLVAQSATAQIVAPGPYYATPSWDQKLPATTRFIVLSNWNNEAVLDRETGLVWEQSPDLNRKTWLNAFMYCASATIGDRRGWRLPTIYDLQSLRDSTPPNGLPAGHPFNGIVSSSDFTSYWSSTASPDDSSKALRATIEAGGVGSTLKTRDWEPPYVLRGWCVRGGPAPDAQ